MTHRKLTTLLGALGIVLGSALSYFGVEVSEDQLTALTGASVTIVSTVLTMFGPSVKTDKTAK